MNSPSTNPHSKPRWVQSWILAGAIGVAMVMAMEVPAPVTFYVFHLVHGLCCAVLLAVGLSKDSNFARIATIVCWTLGWSISGDLWTDPADGSSTLILLRISVSVFPIAAAAVCFPRYFVSREGAGARKEEPVETSR